MEILTCPNCKTDKYLKYIHNDNTSTEQFRRQDHYYQCMKCKGYIQTTTVETIKWTKECPLSDTLA